MRSNAPSAAATGVASSSAHLPTQSFSLSPATVTTHASGACAPSSSDAPSGRGTRTIRAGGRPVSAKSAPASGAAPPSVALPSCARGIGGARGQSGQGNRRRARSGSSWRGRRTIVAEKPPTSRASDQDEMPIKISGVIVNLFRVQASKVFVVCRALTIEFSALTRRDGKPP